jgi:hypothetical protein
MSEDFLNPAQLGNRINAVGAQRMNELLSVVLHVEVRPRAIEDW